MQSILALDWLTAATCVLALGVLAAPYLAAWVRPLGLLLVFVFPVVRDGPLDIDLWSLKLLFVASLLLAHLHRPVLRGMKHRGIACLLLALVGLTIISYSLSATKSLAKDFTTPLMASVILFLLLARAMDRSLLRQAIGCVCLLTATACTLGVVQYATIALRLDSPVLVYLLPPVERLYFFEQNHTMTQAGVRLSSFFFHPNQFSHYLVLAYGFHLAIFLHVRSRCSRLVHGANLVLIGASLVITQSRGAAILIVIETLAIAAAARPRRVAVAAGLVLLLAGVAGLQSGNVRPFLDRLATFGLSSRGEIWRRAIDLIPDHLVFGVGPGSSPYPIIAHYPIIDPVYQRFSFELYSQGRYFLPAIHSHNFFLETLLDTGLSSLVVYLLIVGQVTLLGLRMWRRCRHRLFRALCLAATVPIVASLFRGFFEAHSFLSAPETGGMMALFFAVLFYLNFLVAPSRGTGFAGA